MPVRHYTRASLFIAALTVLTLGCGEGTPVEPGSALLAKGGKSPTKVSLENLVLQSTVLTLGVSGIDYTVDIVNTGKQREGVFIQGEVSQGSALRGAGGSDVLCGAGQAVLPRGTCSMLFTAYTSNSAGGTGILVPGPATFILHVYAADGSELAVTTAAITLQ